MSQAHQLLGDQIAGQRGAEKTTGLVNRPGLEHRQSEIAQKGLTPINHAGGNGSQLQGQLTQRLQVDFLSQIDTQGDDLVSALVHQPVQGQTRFQIAVKG